jgi:hypothetical protein
MRRSPGQKLRDRNILEKSHSIWKKINLFQKLKRKTDDEVEIYARAEIRHTAKFCKRANLRFKTI